jgi:hypothetical protein
MDLDLPSTPDEIRAALAAERPTRLSRSVIWPLQRAFFAHLGVEAWGKGGVPYRITHTPAHSDDCARVIAGHLLDLHLAAPANGPPLEPDEPLYIVELGAGRGRFGPQLLRRLRRARRRLGPGVPRPVLVLTDLCERNLAHWRASRRLRPYFEAGLLDLGRFDLGRDDHLRLERSGALLTEGAVHNPLVLVANYAFDSIPQDAFSFSRGEVAELLLTCSLGAPGLDLERPEGLEPIDVSFSSRRATLPYYGDPDWDDLLSGLRREIAEGVALLPIDALRAIRAFERMSGGRLLLLVGDKGDPESDVLPGLDRPPVVFHGSISLPVSFRAIARYFERRGGFTLALEPRSPFFRTSVFGMGTGRLGHTAAACAPPTAAKGDDRTSPAAQGTTMESEMET